MKSNQKISLALGLNRYYSRITRSQILWRAGLGWRRFHRRLSPLPLSRNEKSSLGLLLAENCDQLASGKLKRALQEEQRNPRKTDLGLAVWNRIVGRRRGNKFAGGILQDKVYSQLAVGEVQRSRDLSAICWLIRLPKNHEQKFPFASVNGCDSGVNDLLLERYGIELPKPKLQRLDFYIGLGFTCNHLRQLTETGWEGYPDKQLYQLPNGKIIECDLSFQRSLFAKLDVLKALKEELMASVVGSQSDLSEFTKQQRRLIEYLRDNGRTTSHQCVCDDVFRDSNRAVKTTAKTIERLNAKSEELGRKITVECDGKVLTLYE